MAIQKQLRIYEGLYQMSTAITVNEGRSVAYEHAYEHADNLLKIAEQIRTIPSAEKIQELRAQAEAVKAWARTYKVTSQVRSELLVIEVRALIRLHELGETGYLNARERKAAQLLAGLSDSDLDDWIAAAGAISTATGLVKMITDEQTRDGYVSTWKKRFEGSPDLWPTTDEDIEICAGAHVRNTRTALAALVKERAIASEPFKVSEITDELFLETIEAARWDQDFRYAEPKQLRFIRDALNEVTRKAIMAYPDGEWEDTGYPAFITTLLKSDEMEEPAFVRIPVMTAKIRDLNVMIRLREKQLKEYVAAVNSLKKFRSALYAAGAENEDTLIGDVMSNNESKVA